MGLAAPSTLALAWPVKRRPSAKPRPTPLRVLEAGPSRIRLASRTTHFEIQVLAPDLFRLLAMAPGQLPEPSWAVVPREPAEVPANLKQSKHRLTISTADARMEWNLATGAWRLIDRYQLEIFSAPAEATVHAGKEPRLTLDLAERESIFGLGESTGPFDKRGLIREFWNIDVLGHAPAIHPGLRSLYVSIPFALSMRDGRAAGLFWDNPGRQTWDLGATREDRWEMKAASGILDVYLFTGPNVETVVRRYTELTGRMPLPPRWALGYQQCRYSYESRAELESVAREFRRRHIPCDVLYCDIHHLHGHRVFTFGRSYPKPEQMLRKLARDGFKVVTIVNPGVKDDPKFGVLRRGLARDAFVKDPTGQTDFFGEVWPGRSRYPDFLQAGVRAWWGEEQQALLRLGVAGIWNDMNEPANFARPDKTLDPGCVHRTEHGPRLHAGVHNVYGQEMARATREGFHAPNEASSTAARPFVLTRSGYAGIQRFAAVWTGDNSSCWEHLADSIRQLLNLGLSGVAFAGADVGGFLDHATPELLVRWLQAAVFTPFLRNHSNLGTRRQEPWAFGPAVEDIARQYINLRYQLLPYLYGLFAEASHSGTPILRPLLWHYPGDPTAVACADQFLLGRNLLIAPILQPGGMARSVYLPRGQWFDFWTGARHAGGVHHCVEAPLDKIPLFVRAGTILPMAETRSHVGDHEPETILLHVWPEDDGSLGWYDDDGRTGAFACGNFQRRTIVSRATPRGGTLILGGREGTYVGDTRTWRVVLRGLRRPPRLTVAGQRAEAQFVPELSLAAFDLPVVDEEIQARWS